MNTTTSDYIDTNDAALPSMTATPLDWRRCIHYPDHVPAYVGHLLDIADGLLPLTFHAYNDFDKLGALLRWLNELKDSGLFTSSEYQRVRSALAREQ